MVTAPSIVLLEGACKGAALTETRRSRCFTGIRYNNSVPITVSPFRARTRGNASNGNGSPPARRIASWPGISSTERGGFSALPISRATRFCWMRLPCRSYNTIESGIASIIVSNRRRNRSDVRRALSVLLARILIVSPTTRYKKSSITSADWPKLK